MSTSTKYRKSAFTATKKRKRKTVLLSTMESEKLDELRNINTPGPSWQDKTGVSEEFSKSNKKIFHEKHESESDEDESDLDESVIESDSWILDMELLVESLYDVAVCKYCRGKLYLKENKSCRAGLATRLIFFCSNGKCQLNIHKDIGFFTSKKNHQVYDINRKIVLAGRVIGKGRQGMVKLCSILGLSPPVCRRDYRNHSETWEEISRDLKDENLALASIYAREAISEETDTNDIVDVPASFDGS